jgi:CcmD family protein
MMKRTCVAVCMMWMLGLMGDLPAGDSVTNWPSTVALHAQQPEAVDEFVPIDELPPQDQLPAAPLLVAAYAFVVLALFAYLVSIARRLSAVQRDLERLQAELKRSGRT